MILLQGFLILATTLLGLGLLVGSFRLRTLLKGFPKPHNDEFYSQARLIIGSWIFVTAAYVIWVVYGLKVLFL
jgi:hypothetical protein